MKYLYTHRQFRYPLFVFLLLLSSWFNAAAQVGNYRFGQYQGSYQPITNGDTVAGATDITNNSLMNNIFVPVRLPFSFNFNGRVFDSCYISENGYITFSPAFSIGGFYPLSIQFPGLHSVISGMSADLWGLFVTGCASTKGSAVINNVGSFAGVRTGLPVAGFGIPAATTIASFDTVAKTITLSADATLTSANSAIRWPRGLIKTGVSGTGSNRKFTIEFAHLSDNSTAANAASDINFQIQLEETTNKVSVIYGPVNVLSTGGTKNCQVGLRGDMSSDFNARTLAANLPWTSTDPAALNTAYIVRGSQSLPDVGLTFTWESQDCYYPDNLTYSRVSSGGMTLHWNNPAKGMPVTGYQWEVRTSGAAGSGATGLAESGTVFGDSAVVKGLDPNTIYNVYVRGNCSAERSNWSIAKNIKIPCDQVVTPPYLEDFKTFVNYPTISPPACWSIATGVLDAGPTIFSGYPIPNNTWNTQAWPIPGGGKMAFLMMLETSQGEWFMSPSIDLGRNKDKQVEFDLLIQNSAFKNVGLGADDTVALVISTDNGLTWSKDNIIHQWTNRNTPLQDTHFVFKLNNYQDTVRLAFYAKEGNWDAAEYIKLHDFSVVNIPCFELNLGNNITRCSDGSRGDTLNAGSLTGATYIWDDQSTDSQRVVNKSGTYSVKVLKDGCTRYDTIVVTYNPYPKPIDLGRDTTICGSDTLWLKAGQPGDLIRWFNGVQQLADKTTFPVGKTGSYRVELTDRARCGTVYDTINVTIIPTLPYVSLGNDTSSCKGTPLILDGGNPGLKTVWNQKVNSLTLNVDTSGTYHVLVTDNDGCTGADTIKVTILPSPAVDLGPDTAFCVQDQIVLDAGEGGTGYLWDDGGVGRTRTITKGGTYSVAVTADNGCTTSDTVSISLHKPALFDRIIVEENGNNTFSFRVVGAKNVLHYSWDFGDGSPAQDEPVVSHKYTNPGNYKVELTVNGEGDCPSYSDNVNLNIKSVGIGGGSSSQLLVKLYPNPNTGVFYLDYDKSYQQQYLSIYDIHGRSVYKELLNGSGHQRVDIAGLPAGAYCLMIGEHVGETTVKFIIQK